MSAKPGERREVYHQCTENFTIILGRNQEGIARFYDFACQDTAAWGKENPHAVIALQFPGVSNAVATHRAIQDSLSSALRTIQSAWKTEGVERFKKENLCLVRYAASLTKSRSLAWCLREVDAIVQYRLKHPGRGIPTDHTPQTRDWRILVDRVNVEQAAFKPGQAFQQSTWQNRIENAVKSLDPSVPTTPFDPFRSFFIAFSSLLTSLPKPLAERYGAISKAAEKGKAANKRQQKEINEEDNVTGTESNERKSATKGKAKDTNPEAVPPLVSGPPPNTGINEKDLATDGDDDGENENNNYEDKNNEGHDEDIDKMGSLLMLLVNDPQFNGRAKPEREVAPMVSLDHETAVVMPSVEPMTTHYTTPLIGLSGACSTSHDDTTSQEKDPGAKGLQAANTNVEENISVQDSTSEELRIRTSLEKQLLPPLAAERGKISKKRRAAQGKAAEQQKKLKMSHDCSCESSPKGPAKLRKNGHGSS